LFYFFLSPKKQNFSFLCIWKIKFKKPRRLKCKIRKSLINPASGYIKEIQNPKNFFDSNPLKLQEVVNVVRSGFGKKTDFRDIYEHVTSPERVYLLEKEKRIVAMASYNKKIFSGFPSLIVEGIAIKEAFQGKGIFKEITENAKNSETVICLRTQNPRMYRALEKFCFSIYPNNKKETPKAVKSIRDEFASYLGCGTNEEGVIKDYYGGLFYGEEPKHSKTSDLFKRLDMDLQKGDAVLLVGIK
jgi:hypothetical protein